jgi:hypothetical protein
VGKKLQIIVVEIKDKKGNNMRKIMFKTISQILFDLQLEHIKVATSCDVQLFLFDRKDLAKEHISDFRYKAREYKEQIYNMLREIEYMEKDVDFHLALINKTTDCKQGE